MKSVLSFRSALNICVAAIGLASATFSLKANSLELGSLLVAGNGCFDKEGALVAIEDNHLIVQVKNMVKKVSTEGLERSTCNFSLPIQLDKNQKLVIKHLDLGGYLNLAANTKLVANGEVFFAGGTGLVTKLIEESEGKRLKKILFSSTDGQIKTSCGASVILRGNSSLLLSGHSLARSTARVDGFTLLAEVQECQE